MNTCNVCLWTYIVKTLIIQIKEYFYIKLNHKISNFFWFDLLIACSAESPSTLQSFTFGGMTFLIIIRFSIKYDMLTTNFVNGFYFLKNVHPSSLHIALFFIFVYGWYMGIEESRIKSWGPSVCNRHKKICNFSVTLSKSILAYKIDLSLPLLSF